MQKFEKPVNADKLYQQSIEEHLKMLRETVEMQWRLEHGRRVKSGIASKKRK